MTRNRLIEELEEMRRRVAYFEKLDAERKEREDALRESEAKLRFIAENVGDVIWQLDTEFCFTYVSPPSKGFPDTTPGR